VKKAEFPPRRTEPDSPAPEPAMTARRQFLRGLGLALLPATAIGFSSCTAPKYDPDRGVWVMHPKK
jgi:hypothetical protein